MRGPTCQSPCRICDAKSVQLGDIPSIDLNKQTVHQVTWQYRSVDKYIDILSNVQSNHRQGQMEVYEAKLKQNGFTFHPVRNRLFYFVF